MMDDRYSHYFIPGINKFDGFEIDNFSPHEQTYERVIPFAAGRKNLGEQESDAPLFSPHRQGQIDTPDETAEFRPT